MSRTIRQHYRTKRVMRDGDRQFAAGSCNHHGGCGWCEGNRLHATQRRQVAAQQDLQAGDEYPADLDVYDDWEAGEIDRIYGALGDDDPLEHYPVTSRMTPDYIRHLRRPS